MIERLRSDPARWRSALLLPLSVALAALVFGLLAIPGISSARDRVQGVDQELDAIPPMPDPDELAQRSVVRAADGSIIAWLSGPENRLLVPLEQVPEVMQQAVLATEDQEFYDHEGINHEAVFRALVNNVRAGEVESGASTITQQYVKNAMLTNEQTVARKLKEAVYATELEEELSKDEILEGYLNLAYFGNGAYGVKAATEFYFGKDLAEITAAEAALLAGLIRAPRQNDPVANPDAALARRNIVLEQMATANFIEREVAEDLKDDPLGLNITPLPGPAFPFYIEYVKALLLDDPRLGETRADRIRTVFEGGLTIETTLRPEFQRRALDAIRERLQDPLADPLAGIVSIDPRDGRVTTLAVGPKQFGECDDVPEACATTKVMPVVAQLGGSGRQVGSAFKPILDTAALVNGFPTSWSTSTRSGKPIDGCIDYVDGRETPWTPRNYSGGGSGVLDMPAAIRQSNNVYHASLIAALGPEKAVEVAQLMGIDSELPAVCSLSLGAGDVFPLDMAEAFGTLANGGVRCEPFTIDRVLDRDGNVLLDDEPACEQVIPQDVADKMVTMMRDVVTRGTATRAQVAGFDLAGKTGTTNDFRDAWFVGFERQLVTATWVGYEIPREMVGILGFARIAGGTVPAQIWQAYMEPVLTGHFEPQPLPRVDLDRYSPPVRTAPPSGGGGDAPPSGGEAPPPPPPPPSDGGGNGGGNGNGNGNGNGGGNDDDGTIIDP